MPNNARTQPDGTWVDGYAPTPADWADLERKIFESWNGDQGGAYCALPNQGGYTFGGSGLLVTGPTRLTKAGALQGGAGVFVVPDGTWPKLAPTHKGATRKIVQPITTFHSPRRYLWSRNHAYAGIGSIALAARATFGSTLETPEAYVPLRVVDGATLTQVEFRFRVARPRLYAPLTMPKFRILRVPSDSAGAAPEPLKKTTDGLGFDSPPLVTSPDDWYSGGDVQSFVYACDQNATIDVTNYSYVAHIVEEQGALTAQDPFDGLRVVEHKGDVIGVVPNTDTLSGLVGGGAGTPQVENISVGLESRFLVVDPDGVAPSGKSAKNGIWVDVSGAAWQRWKDLDAGDDFTPNWFVRVLWGSKSIFSVWQCQSPTSSQTVNLTASGTVADQDLFPQYTWPKIVPAEPQGNIYHALVPTFGVADLRFQ